MSLHAARRAATSARPFLLVLLALLATTSLDAQRVARRTGVESIPPVSPRTKWPSTRAVAIVGRGAPIVVEATSDGWVVLTPVGPWAESYDSGVSKTRLQVTPSEVRKWTNAIRTAPSDAPAAATNAMPEQPNQPRLGRGLVQLVTVIQTFGRQRRYFTFQRCDGVGAGWVVSPEDLSDLLKALDRAAVVAEQGSPRAIPPTLSRPYYASEVSCSAAPMGGNAPAKFPSDAPAALRRYTDVGVRFVVDTSGYVEARSITMLPGAPPLLARATRELLVRWRYRPAVRGGAPVRQVVSTAVTFDPARPDLPERSPRLPTRYQAPGFGVNDTFGDVDLAEQRAYLATDDGWVQVRVGTWNRTGAFSGAQEWFSPDSVDAWAARARTYITTDSARVRRPKSYAAERAAELKHPMGNTFEVRYMTGLAADSQWAPRGEMRGCSGPVYRGDRIDSASIERFVAAARAARAERATPREPTDSAYARGDVACAAVLPDAHALQAELNVWRSPRGPIPASMESRNVRTEVLTSFVVDANGIPKPSTLVAMPGSDRRAVAALRASLERYRFQPATRSGVRVNAFVIRNWSFEPRPRCRDSYDGLECPRVYSDAARR